MSIQELGFVSSTHTQTKFFTIRSLTRRGARSRSNRSRSWRGRGCATGQSGTLFRIEAHATDLTIAGDDREIRGRVDGAGAGEGGVCATGVWAGSGCADAEHGEGGTRADAVVGVDALVWILILKGTGDGGCWGDVRALGGGRRCTGSPSTTTGHQWTYLGNAAEIHEVELCKSG